MKDIDRLISEADERIKKLKNLKAKQEKLEKLEAGVKGKPKKEHMAIPSISLRSSTRKAIASFVALSLVLISIMFFAPTVFAAEPAINYADPAGDSRFADTQDGDGVNWVVNVTDDGDLQWVKLYSNDSGAWLEFYDSGALDGVDYHNASGTNGNWTGSWTKYWYNISADDGTTYDTTYNFTTRYQWGYPEMAKFGGGTISYQMGGMPYKNNTGEYYLSVYDYTNLDVEVKKSATGTNWSLMGTSDVDTNAETGTGVWDFFTYNNEPAFFYVGADEYVRIAHTSNGGSSWTTTSTGIEYTDHVRGCAIEYYDGYWQLAIGAGTHLRHYRGTPWSTWTQLSDLGAADTWAVPSLALLDGTLHLVYKDGPDEHLRWKTYNGVTWTDKGVIDADISYGCSMVKDPVNQQLICVYVNGAGDLVYRITDNTTSWSSDYTIGTDSSFYYPQVNFMDARLVIAVSWNKRGTWNIYTISAPGYVERTSGLNTIYNRIQWPDAAPDDVHVNSTVFSMKNIDNRSINTIQWHFEDIGEITVASNIEMWTNMSGSWASIGTCDADGNVSTLDISDEMAGGAEWIVGQTIYWKAEILAIGSISEDIHTTDEDIWYKITFA